MDGKQYPVDEWLSGEPDLTFDLGMRIGHVRSCCSSQNGINRSLLRLFSIFCFSLGFSIAFGVLGFEENVEKKETWMSLMKHGHQLGFVHESRTAKNISKNNLTCLSSLHIHWLCKRSNYSAYKPRENCRESNDRIFYMLHISRHISMHLTR